MDRYMLTDEGTARYKRTKIRMEMEVEARTEGFEVLDYLYEHGAATAEEIIDNTGLSYEQVVSELENYLAWDYVES